MKIVILGLSISSSWGNGHATTWRSLVKALTARGHSVLFLERDRSWYANARDLPAPDFCQFALYQSLDELKNFHADTVAEAGAVIVGSYVPEGIAVADWVFRQTRGTTAFYDIDTPITLRGLEQGSCEYLTASQVGEFDLYLSFSGGPILEILEEKYHAQRAESFYCSVDPTKYSPESAAPHWDLGYLGTYSHDRQPGLERLLIEPAKQLAARKFVVAGSQFPSISWPGNLQRIEHLPPDRHRGFYNAQRYTLNITRQAMVASGWSPSVRLFEAAACETPIISDQWSGLETFFKPGEEIFTASSTQEVISILKDVSEEDRREMAKKAAARVAQEHTSEHRAIQLEKLLTGTISTLLEESFV